MAQLTVSEQLREIINSSIYHHAEIERETGVSRSSVGRFVEGSRLYSDSIDKLCSFFKLELRPIQSKS